MWRRSAGRVVVGAVSTVIGVFALVEATVPEAPIALLIPPDLPPVPFTRSLPATPLALPPGVEETFAELGSACVGVAAVDASGRVRERTLLARLGWCHGEALDLRVNDGVAALWPAPYGHVRVDGRDQFALPRGSRTLLGIGSGDRVLLSAFIDLNVLFVYPMPTVLEWIRKHLAEHSAVFNA